MGFENDKYIIQNKKFTTETQIIGGGLQKKSRKKKTEKTFLNVRVHQPKFYDISNKNATYFWVLILNPAALLNSSITSSSF